MLERRRQSVFVSIDRLKYNDTRIAVGESVSLNLEKSSKNVYFGGFAVDRLKVSKSRRNFEGFLQELHFNGQRIIEGDLKAPNDANALEELLKHCKWFACATNNPTDQTETTMGPLSKCLYCTMEY